MSNGHGLDKHAHEGLPRPGGRSAGTADDLGASQGRSAEVHPFGHSLAVTEELSRLRRILGAFAAGFNPYLVTCSEALVVADEATRIQSIASVVKELAASRAG